MRKYRAERVRVAEQEWLVELSRPREVAERATVELHRAEVVREALDALDHSTAQAPTGSPQAAAKPPVVLSGGEQLADRKQDLAGEHGVVRPRFVIAAERAPRGKG